MSEAAVAPKPRVRVPAYVKDTETTAAPAKAEAFSFGEPTPVIDGYDFFYTGCWMLGMSGMNHRWTFPCWPKPIAPRRTMAQPFR